MPTKLPTPCSHGRCPELTHDRYCEQHNVEKWRGDDRPSASDRGYDQRWKKVRDRYIRKNPLCEHCTANGHTTPAVDVDHIEPIASGGARLDTDNLQALCRRCHNRKTAAAR